MLQPRRWWTDESDSADGHLPWKRGVVHRVLHLSHSHIGSDGRILKQLASLSRGLPSVEFHACSLGGSAGEAEGAPLDGVTMVDLLLVSRRLRVLGRQVRHAAMSLEMLVRMIFNGLRLRPSVVHCHDFFALPAAFAISVLCRGALVYDAHELESRRNYQTRRMGRLVFSIERWCWRRVSLLVSVSPSILDWYAANLGPKRSVLVLNSPVRAPASIGDASRVGRSFGQQGYFHRRFGIPGGIPVFIFVGHFVRGKGIEPVLDVFRRPGLRSHVVFMGGRDRLGVAGHAERFGNIHLHPAVPHDQVVRLVGEADCGLCLFEDRCLSLRYSLPNKLFEYAFAGVPVLASRLPEIARVVEHYGLGVCCDGDADGIEAVVRRIERDGIPRPAADLSELSWDAQAKRLQDAYSELLSKRSA
jgi:glycosyltransferase involved in cell wall biosynthesis